MQTTMFDGKEQFINDKPIRLIELFGGIGCQAKALTNLGIDFEHYRMCDFDKYAVQSYNAVHGTNFVPTDITKITAEDLEIVETDKYNYIMTYSFPCQSLSVAGKQEGMAKDSGTRSGLLWEVERLLNECKELPQVLLMENVPQVHGKKNKESFREWCTFLESKGYKNYWQDLNAKNYGIPQNRNRTFMVSLLGDYCYEFPEPIELKLRLKDLLETEVDEKYYLSEKALNGKINSNFGSNNINSIMEKDGIIPTLMERDYKDPKLVLVVQLDGFESSGRVYSEDGIAPTINTMGGGNREPKVAINLKTKNKRLKSMLNKIDVSKTQAIDIYNQTVSDEMNTIKTTIDTSNMTAITQNYRIRKLTPKECWRLMGLIDTDFDKAKESGVSNSQLYKQAGNGIVVNVLMYIFNQMVGE